MFSLTIGRFLYGGWFDVETIGVANDRKKGYNYHNNNILKFSSVVRAQVLDTISLAAHGEFMVISSYVPSISDIDHAIHKEAVLLVMIKY